MSRSFSSKRTSTGTKSRTASASSVPADSSIQDVLEGLTALETDGHRVVSCYLKLEPRDRARGKFLIKLKNRAKAAEQRLERMQLSRDERESVVRDLGRVVDYLRVPGNLPSAQGVAVFACEDADLFEVAALPVVHRSRLAVDRSPLVRELAAVEDEIGRLITVVLDRSSARFFEVGAFGATELPGLTSPTSAHGRPRAEGKSMGWSEHNYHNRIREEKQRHYEAVARRLFELDRRHAVHGFVVCASGTDGAALEPFLHTYVVERMLGSAKLIPKSADAATVHEATLQVRREWEGEAERMLVEEVANSLGGGWAVNGVSETLRALSRGQVRALLVQDDTSMEGFRAEDTGRLALHESEIAGEGRALPVIDVLDDAIEDALRQHIDVNVVFDEEAAGRVDGLAALLRFR